MTDDPTPVLLILMSLSGACCAIAGALLAFGGIYMYYRSEPPSDSSATG